MSPLIALSHAFPGGQRVLGLSVWLFTVCKMSERSVEHFAEVPRDFRPKTRWPLLSWCNKPACRPGVLAILRSFLYIYSNRQIEFSMFHRNDIISPRAGMRTLVSRIGGFLADWIGKEPRVCAEEGEEFWNWVREQYELDPCLINLNNGGISPQPKSVQDAYIGCCKYCNPAPSYFMWRELSNRREPLRRRLADMAGVSPGEVAINRNATEGLNSVIFGLDLKAGDEVVLSRQEYPNMINAWKQREKRDGVRLTWVDLSLPSGDNRAITEVYTRKFTDRTRIIHLSHMVHWTGQILPVRMIADEAHRHNIDVICDAAHTFAHLDYQIPDLGCDYWATSLHKWLCAPCGSGMLWIRKDRISKVWALLSSEEPDGEDIRKFESVGTRSFAFEIGIDAAIDFHELIGSGRKEARLRLLRDYWVNQVKDLPGVTIHTPLSADFSCAIATVSIAGLNPREIEAKLLKKYRIHCAAVKCGSLEGVRIAPHVYTSLKELDVLAAGIRGLAGMRKME